MIPEEELGASGEFLVPKEEQEFQRSNFGARRNYDARGETLVLDEDLWCQRRNFGAR